MNWDPDLVDEALRHLRRSDPVMRELIDRVGPFRMTLQRSRFRSLLRAIIAQQISGSAARSIWRRLQEAARPGPPTAEKLIAMSTEELRAVGLSPQKLAYVRDLAARTTDGTLRLSRMGRRSDEEVIAELVQVKGIGLWTAQMFLMFSLGRPDVMPHGDLGIRTTLRDLYGLPDLPQREESLEIARPWRPYATVACWYCWRRAERNGPRRTDA